MTDKFLFEEVIKLKNTFNSEIFIETGTWTGKSLSILAPYFEILKSIEINEEKYKEALENNKSNNNVVLYCGNSTNILPNIINSRMHKAIFFLDAHWGEYWPLLDELQIIANFNLKPVIIIHDFYVPDENGNPKFGYDRYKDIPLDYNYVEEKIIRIYGKEKYKHYCIDKTEINAGTGIFTPL